VAKVNKELHLFMPIGDDEIQVDSWNKEINKAVMELKEIEPDSTVILYDEEYPQFLRAAVKTDNITIKFHKKKVIELTEEQKAARSENGKQHTDNLKYQNK
jgi:seryl-tRNA synthetase